MLGNGVEMSLIYGRILGTLVLGWTPNHFVLGAQLAPGEKRLVRIPDRHFFFWPMQRYRRIAVNACSTASKPGQRSS